MTNLFEPDFSGNEVTATGRFRICTLHPIAKGGDFSALLSNCTHTLQAIIPASLHDRSAAGIELNGTVLVGGILDQAPRCLIVQDARPVQACIDLLPQSACPASKHDLLLELTATVQSFHPFVQRFVELALAYQDQYLRFLQIPASTDCHHAEAGGLLEHSLEVVKFLKLMPPLQTTTAPICRDFVLALGLLHDLGKCYAGVEFQDGKRPGHDELTSKALAMGFSFLGEVWPTAVEFTKFVFGSGWRQSSPSCVELIMIKLADQMSASIDARDHAFAELPELFRFAPVEYRNGSQRTFRRLLPPRKPNLH